MIQEEVFPDISNDNIAYFGQRIEPFFASAHVVGGLVDEKLLRDRFDLENPVSWIKHVADHNRHNYDFFVVRNERDAFLDQVKRKIGEGGTAYVDNLIHQCERDGEALVSFTQSLVPKQEALSTLTREVLSRILLTFYEHTKKYTVWYTIAFFEKPELEILETVIQKYALSQEERAQWFLAATSSDKMTDTEKEWFDFLSLRVYWEESAHTESEREKALQRHISQYGWLGVRFFLGDWWTIESIRQRLEQMSYKQAKEELLSSGTARQKNKDTFSQMKKILSGDDFLLARQVASMVYLRTQRADFFHHASALFQKVLREASNRLGLSFHDILYFSPQEIVRALEDISGFCDELARRKRDMVVYCGYGRVASLSGERSIRYVSEHPALCNTLETREDIIGNSAFRGKVSGICRIVFTPEECNNVQEGDILVATMTTPNFISAMQRASAFVTDEGGILCHASIVAREMRKPCIIGTKIATKVLKDGDLVEVDANEGVVKILKKDG